MKTRKYKSKALEAAYTSANDLFKAGVIDKQTMRDFEDSCCVPTPELSAKQIKKIREENHLSQPVFALYLNTSKSTVQKWEIGAKHPSGMALKLLSVVQKHGIHVLD